MSDKLEILFGSIFLLVFQFNQKSVTGQCYQTIYSSGDAQLPTGGTFFTPKCPNNYTLSTLSGSLCYPDCDSEHVPYGPLCYLKGCRGAYKYSCNLPLLCAQLLTVPGIGPGAASICSSQGLLCTLNQLQCAQMNEKIGIASTIALRNIAAFIATQGAIALDPGIDIQTAASGLDLLSNIFNEFCHYPNKEATQCFKPSINSQSVYLANCTSKMSFDCGAFCTTSQAQCAKISSALQSMVMYIVASVTGAPDALAALKNLPVGALQKATIFIKKKPLPFWINLIKNTASQNSEYTAALFGLQSVMDLILPFKFQCKIKKDMIV